MRISFDLDDLLICGIKKFPNEKSSFLSKLLGMECIRKGTVALMKRLQGDGHEVYIYTSSLRSPFRIKLMFLLYGIQLQGAINKIKHDKRNKMFGKTASKFPPMFGIDLHIDDSEGVKREGEMYGFDTLVISEDDDVWTEHVLEAVRLPNPK